MVSLFSTNTTLPVVNSLPECADFTKTVAPYLPQLQTLPQQIVARYNDFEALKQLYLSTNPLVTAFAFAVYFLAPVVLVVSEINRNYSQIDRLWSLLPVLYNCHYTLWAHLNGLPTQRLDHVMAVSTLWGVRLTFNYWRKGGYSIGSEDYRWAIVKHYVGPFWMFVFNVVFISWAQSILLFLITTPTYVLLLSARLTGDELTTYDNFFPKAMFVAVLVEFWADQQQWTFHQAKSEYKTTAKVPKDYGFTREQLDWGFNTTGLFAWSRHPNFAAEQAVWMCLYQWCCCETYTFVNWTFAGAFAYLILFQASTWLTELISVEKYPEYKIYQQRVGKFLPKGNTKSMGEPVTSKERKKLEEVKGKSEEQKITTKVPGSGKESAAASGTRSTGKGRANGNATKRRK